MSSLDNISFTDNKPTGLTVTLSVEQAALIADWAGKFSPKLAGSAYEHTHDLYELFEYYFFNLFYEDGRPEAMREFALPDLTAVIKAATT